MKVLVTGGSGFVGRHLVEALTRRGRDVVVLGRGEAGPPPSARGTDAGNVQIATWSPERLGDWTRWVEESDAVVHLAGAGIFDERWSAERLALVKSSRVDSTTNLARAIAEAKSKPRVFVSASAIGYYGSRGDEALTESSAPGSGFMADVCVAWEKEADAAAALGMRLVKLRTGVVLGQNGGALAKMLPPFKGGMGGKLGSGDQWMSWIHHEDVIGLIRHALDQPIAGPINAVAPNPVTNQEFTRRMGDALHRPTLFPVPEFAVKALFGEMAQIVLGSQRILPKAAESSGYRFRYPELAPALQSLFA